MTLNYQSKIKRGGSAFGCFRSCRVSFRADISLSLMIETSKLWSRENVMSLLQSRQIAGIRRNSLLKEGVRVPREGEERCNRYDYTFIPRGGSIVILLLFCRMLMGKSGEGADVSHNRNA